MYVEESLMVRCCRDLESSAYSFIKCCTFKLPSDPDTLLTKRLLMIFPRRDQAMKCCQFEIVVENAIWNPPEHLATIVPQSHKL